MKRQLIIESDGHDGLIAYIDGTPIVTFGTTLDEVIDNVLMAVEEYNAQLPQVEHIVMADVVLSSELESADEPTDTPD